MCGSLIGLARCCSDEKVPIDAESSCRPGECGMQRRAGVRRARARVRGVGSAAVPRRGNGNGEKRIAWRMLLLGLVRRGAPPLARRLPDF